MNPKNNPQILDKRDTDIVSSPPKAKTNANPYLSEHLRTNTDIARHWRTLRFTEPLYLQP